MKLHDLRPAPGSTRRPRRVGRGTAGKGGKTAGRGMKGQKARSRVKPGFEGGQLPLTQRVPKLKGFTNPFKVEFEVVNLDGLQRLEEEVVTPDTLRSHGLVAKSGLVKVLARGELSRAVRVEAHAFSAAAERAIGAAGGSAIVIPRNRARPPARGNALTNR